jgi:hypothetical protein
LFIIGKTAHNPRAKVPWEEINSHPDKFLYTKYVPELVHIKEPSRMPSQQVSDLCSFFLKRQLRGQKIFRFKAIDPDDKREGYSRSSQSSSDESDETELPEAPLKVKPRILSMAKKVKENPELRHVGLYICCIFLLIW